MSLSRRSLLKAVAGGAGAFALLPILEQITRAGGAAPRRFLIVVEGNCYEPITVRDKKTLDQLNAHSNGAKVDDLRWWFQQTTHTSPLIVDDTQFDTTLALPALATEGLAKKAAVLFGLSSRITGGGHTAYHGVLSSSRTVGGIPGGKTIDAYLAELPAVRGMTPYDAVRVGTTSTVGVEQLAYYTCALDKGRAAACIVDALAAYSLLFGVVGSPAQQQEFAQRKTILDFANKDLSRALAAFGGSSDERKKLESYIASLEEVSKRQDVIQKLSGTLASVAPPSPDVDPKYATDCLYRFETQLRLAAASLKGGLTNVAVVTSGTGDDFNFLTYPSAPDPAYQDTIRHSLHHQSADDPGSLKTIHDVTRIQLDAIAAVAKDLDDTPDKGGTMLDNTLIVFIGDNGEQHHSSASDFPVVLLGGGGMGINTGGRTIVYPSVDKGGKGHRQVSNLWNTLSYAAGTPMDTFGQEGPTRVAPGPLAELM